MSMRFSIDEALEKGWITEEQAKAQKKLTSESKRAKVRMSSPGSKNDDAKSSFHQFEAQRFVCSLDGDLPQEKLWRACVKRWPEKIKNGELVWEFAGAIPGRKFRLDVAFTKELVAVETDGWQHHGRFLSDFKRDRLRDRLLVINGWRVLRFFAEEIHDDPDLLTEEIDKALRS